MSNKKLNLARKLRKNMTESERKLWRVLRFRQFQDKFRKQTLVGTYIVDFVCFEKRLIVEVDGGQHVENAEADAKRSRWLESQGFKVVRYWNHNVLRDTSVIMEAIWNEMQIRPSIFEKKRPNAGKRKQLPPRRRLKGDR